MHNPGQNLTCITLVRIWLPMHNPGQNLTCITLHGQNLTWHTKKLFTYSHLNIIICKWNIFYLHGRTLPANMKRRQINPENFAGKSGKYFARQSAGKKKVTVDLAIQLVIETDRDSLINISISYNLLQFNSMEFLNLNFLEF